MNISSPRMIASPSPADGRAGASLVSPTPTDIQDTNSSHSDQLINNSSPSALAHNSDHSNQINNKQTAAKSHHSNQADSHRMNLKTEYKSNFTPFDQYVYNELTDSFVKQQTSAPCNNLLIQSNCRTGASNSNQNLTSGAHSDLHVANSASPALEVSAFEPNNGADHHYDVTNEPWYKEVVKRNEKANEYRFKSEVGHNSPLLKDGSTNDEPMTRRSPLCIETLMDSQSANGDSTSSQGLEELSSKRSYKFTPHDYKRDHLIATMANNNNFNLPKKHSTPETSRVTPARRAPANSATTSGSARPSSRTTAQVRARSQSSRRQNAAAPQTVTKEPATKSNLTTPVKAFPNRATTAARVPAPHTTTRTTKAPISSTTRTTAKPVNSVSNGAPSTTRPSSTVSRRAPTSASTGRAVTNSTTSRLSKNAPVATRPPAASSSISRTSPKVANRVIVAPTTKTTSTPQQAPKSPVKRIVGNTTGNRTTPATNRPITSTSVRNSMAGNRALATKSSSPSTDTTTTNAIKSIKTKALTDAGEKAVAVALTSDPKLSLTSDPNKEEASQDYSEREHVPKDFEESNINKFEDRVDQPIGRTNADYYMNQEPNLIFTTTESGNMLADEIAQAEREAQQKELQEPSSGPVDATASLDNSGANSNNPDAHAVVSDYVDLGSQEHVDVCADDNSETKVESQPGDLVNGLTGQIVSAEDRYDSSEHDASVDFEAQQASQTAGQLEQNNDDEPYSIMPTTFDALRHETQQNLSEELENRDSDSSRSSHNEIIAEHISQPTREHVEMDEFEVNRAVADEKLVHGNSSERASDINKENSHLLELNSTQSEENIKDEITEHEQAPDRFKGNELEMQIDNQQEPETASSHQILDHDIDPKNDSDDFKHDDKGLKRASECDIQLQEHDDMVIDKNDHTFSEKIEPKLTQNSRADSISRSITDFGGQDSELAQQSPLTEEATDFSDNFQGDFTEQHQKPERHEELEVTIQQGQSEDVANKNSVYVPDLHEDFAIEASTTMDLKQELSTDKVECDQQSHKEDNEPPQQQQQQKTDTQTQIASNINYERVSESNDSEDESIDERADHNELLMNVADLLDAESRKKKEMARKSELARQQSNSRASLDFSQPTEILLSPDQLNGQLEQSNDSDGISATGNLPRHGDDNNKDLNIMHENEVSQHAAPFSDDVHDVSGKSGKQHETRFESDDLIISVVETDNSPDIKSTAENVNQNPVESVSTEDLVNFGSLTSGQDQAAGETELYTNSQQNNSDDATVLKAASLQDDSRSSFQQVDANEKPDTDLVEVVDTCTRMSEHDDMKINMEQKLLHFNKSQESIEEREADSDDEEQLKLSNHLTNSDDDVILEPRNTKSILDDDYSPHKIVAGSRYNEGAGLGLITQEEQLDGLDTAELADGSSAEIIEPTVVEKRIELSTSKSMVPDILPSSTFMHGPKFSQGGNIDYDDDDQDLNLDPNADPIDVAATMSPSSSVAEEMMRSSRNASNASTTNVASKLIDELSISKSYSDEFSRASLATDADTKEQSSKADHPNKEQLVDFEGSAMVDKHEDTLTVSCNIDKGLDHSETSGPFERAPADKVEKSPQTISFNTDESSGFSAGNLNITNNNNNDLNSTMNDSNTTKQNSHESSGNSNSDSDNSDVSQVPSSMMIKGHKE